jgi:soluble lytic murein transglycosylase-like protein
MMKATIRLAGVICAVLCGLVPAALAAKPVTKWPPYTNYVLRCVPNAASYHKVNPQVLAAIAWVESRFDPSARAVNTNGTTDVGAFQINSIHAPLLSQHGIKKEDLHDPCVAAYVAAWLYAQHVRRLGRTWAAVGAYHSQTPHRQRWYANRVAQVLMNWEVIPKGDLPYPE